MSNQNWGLLFLLAAFWGASFMFTSIALQSVDFLPLVSYRIALAALVLWGIALFKRWPIPRGKIWFHFLITGLFMCALPFSLIVWGQQYVESGLTGIFNAGTAIFGAALSPFFFNDERMTWNKAIGVLIGFSGIVVAIGVNNLAAISLYSLGQWAIIGATLSYAIGGIYAKSFLKTPPQINAVGMVSSAAVVMLIVAFFYPKAQDFMPDLSGAFSIVYLAVIGTACAYLLYYHLLKAVGVAYVTLVTLIIPIFAIFFGAAFLHEDLSLNHYLGFLLLALGLIIIDGRLFNTQPPKNKPIRRQ